MSANKKKVWVRCICGFLAVLMVGSCLAVLAPLFG